jgi:hypothetical protein
MTPDDHFILIALTTAAQTRESGTVSESFAPKQKGKNQYATDNSMTRNFEVLWANYKYKNSFLSGTVSRKSLPFPVFH